MKQNCTRRTCALLLAFGGLLLLCRPMHAQALYISSYDGVWRVSPDGTVRLFASNDERLINSAGLAVDSHGNVFVAVFDSSSVIEIAPDGKLKIFASGGLIHYPAALALDKKDNVYVANNGSDIVRITPQGKVSPFALDSHLAFPAGLSFDREGVLYASNPYIPSIVRITPDGKTHPFVRNEALHGPSGLAFSASGILYTLLYDTHTIVRFAPSGEMTIVASGEELKGASGIAIAPGGDLYVVSRECLRRVAKNGSTEVVARNLPKSAQSLAFDLSAPFKPKKRVRHGFV